MADANFLTRYTQFFPIIPGPLPIVGPLQSNGKPVNYTGGITSDVNTVITAIGRHNGLVVTLALNAGFFYPYELHFVLTATPASNLVGLF